MTKTIDALVEALETCTTDEGPTQEELNSARAALAQARAEQALASGEIKLPEPTFQTVAEGIEVGYDVFGGADIRLGGDFVYVHINYDYRYTDNATRHRLANNIVGLLTATPPAAPVAKLEPLTRQEIRIAFHQHTGCTLGNDVVLAERVTRAIEAAHNAKLGNK